MGFGDAVKRTEQYVGKFDMGLAACNKLLSEKSLRKEGKRSNSTVNRYCAALSHCFTIAVKEWEWLQENPMSKMKKLKEEAKLLNL